ncbi:hypothetical protein VNO77_25223 [Canavalia gladiata]|uniref:Uncharacterized protein n=1 Tax=Canavalia gladiata TaxID=3824 RepID=A0AAN9LB47_CANGL
MFLVIYISSQNLKTNRQRLRFPPPLCRLRWKVDLILSRKMSYKLVSLPHNQDISFAYLLNLSPVYTEWGNAYGESLTGCHWEQEKMGFLDSLKTTQSPKKIKEKRAKTGHQWTNFLKMTAHKLMHDVLVMMVCKSPRHEGISK